MTVISHEQINKLAQLAERQIGELNELPVCDPESRDLIKTATDDRQTLIAELQATDRDIVLEEDAPESCQDYSDVATALVTIDHALKDALASGISAFSTKSRVRDILEKHHSALSRKVPKHLLAVAASL